MANNSPQLQRVTLTADPFSDAENEINRIFSEIFEFVGKRRETV